MPLGAARRLLTARLREAGIATPELDARLLVQAVTGLDHAALVSQEARALAPVEAAQLLAMAARRQAREPVSRILGWREFWGRRFTISPATLDPRPDTETLMGAVLAILDRRGRLAEPLAVLDLGTGSGCLLVSLLAELPQAWGIGVDRCEQAARVARRNAEAHGVAKRAGFIVGDWSSSLRHRFDVVVANPPYIAEDERAALMPEVAEFDPALALFADAAGLAAYHQIGADLPRCLGSAGFAVFETGVAQGEAVIAALAAMGLRPVPEFPPIWRDLGDRSRAVAVETRW